MCGRYALFSSVDIIAGMFAAAVRLPTPLRGQRYNIAPGQAIAAIRTVGGAAKPARACVALGWGFVPRWVTGDAGRRPSINARIESAAASPAFGEALAIRRCVVPADLFYEWQAPAAGRGLKQPFAVRAADHRPLALAGIWESRRLGTHPGGGPEHPETCAILTRDPVPVVARIHDRMPVILPSSAWDDWLDPRIDDAAAAARLAASAQPPPLVAFAVSRRINDPAADDLACITPQASGSLFDK